METRDVKKRVGPLSRKLRDLFIRHLESQGEEMPTMQELQEARFRSDNMMMKLKPAGPGPGKEFDKERPGASACGGRRHKSRYQSKTAVFDRFKAWASRMQLGPDGCLLCRGTDKKIVPIEDFQSIVMELHTGGLQTGSYHRSLRSTIKAMRQEYAVGRRQFGISLGALRNIVRKCRADKCPAKSHMRHESMQKKQRTSKQHGDYDTDSSSSSREDESDPAEAPPVTPTIASPLVESLCEQGIAKERYAMGDHEERLPADYIVGQGHGGTVDSSSRQLATDYASPKADLGQSPTHCSSSQSFDIDVDALTKKVALCLPRWQSQIDQGGQGGCDDPDLQSTDVTATVPSYMYIARVSGSGLIAPAAGDQRSTAAKEFAPSATRRKMKTTTWFPPLASSGEKLHIEGKKRKRCDLRDSGEDHGELNKNVTSKPKKKRKRFFARSKKATTSASKKRREKRLLVTKRPVEESKKTPIVHDHDINSDIYGSSTFHRHHSGEETIPELSGPPGNNVPAPLGLSSPMAKSCTGTDSTSRQPIGAFNYGSPKADLGQSPTRCSSSQSFDIDVDALTKKVALCLPRWQSQTDQGGCDDSNRQSPDVAATVPSYIARVSGSDLITPAAGDQCSTRRKIKTTTWVPPLASSWETQLKGKKRKRCDLQDSGEDHGEVNKNVTSKPKKKRKRCFSTRPKRKAKTSPLKKIEEDKRHVEESQHTAKRQNTGKSKRATVRVLLGEKEKTEKAPGSLENNKGKTPLQASQSAPPTISYSSSQPLDMTSATLQRSGSTVMPTIMTTGPMIRCPIRTLRTSSPGKLSVPMSLGAPFPRQIIRFGPVTTKQLLQCLQVPLTSGSIPLSCTPALQTVVLSSTGVGATTTSTPSTQASVPEASVSTSTTFNRRYQELTRLIQQMGPDVRRCYLLDRAARDNLQKTMSDAQLARQQAEAALTKCTPLL